MFCSPGEVDHGHDLVFLLPLVAVVGMFFVGVPVLRLVSFAYARLAPLGPVAAAADVLEPDGTVRVVAHQFDAGALATSMRESSVSMDADGGCTGAQVSISACGALLNPAACHRMCFVPCWSPCGPPGWYMRDVPLLNDGRYLWVSLAREWARAPLSAGGMDPVALRVPGLLVRCSAVALSVAACVVAQTGETRPNAATAGVQVAAAVGTALAVAACQRILWPFWRRPLRRRAGPTQYFGFGEPGGGAFRAGAKGLHCWLLAWLAVVTVPACVAGAALLDGAEALRSGACGLEGEHECDAFGRTALLSDDGDVVCAFALCTANLTTAWGCDVLSGSPTGTEGSLVAAFWLTVLPACLLGVSLWMRAGFDNQCGWSACVFARRARREKPRECEQLLAVLSGSVDAGGGSVGGAGVRLAQVVPV